MDPLSLRFTPDDVRAKTAAIAGATLAGSHLLRSPNFTVIAPADLARLFQFYDRSFFDGYLREAVNRQAEGRLKFRLAPRMTRAGGKTFRMRKRIRRGLSVTQQTAYEIAISSRLLFLSFGDAARPVTVCGLPCVDRLSALQRIMEHEILHLLETIVWDKSSCAARRFKLLSRNIFNHAASTHDLVTPTERAGAQFNLRPGDRVAFRYEGQFLTGVLNRINRRATVLVESRTGTRYTDGRHYQKYYVPLATLQKLAPIASLART